MAMEVRTVVLGELPQAEKQRFLDFLIANRIQFSPDETGETFAASLQIVPPQTDTSCVVYRAEKRPGSRAGSNRPDSGGDSAREGFAPKTRSTIANAGMPSVLTSGYVNSDLPSTLKAVQVVLRRTYLRFCNLLPFMLKAPKQLKPHAILRFAEDVYDARYLLDSANIRSEAAGETPKAPQSFPDHVFEFASKRYGLKALVGNNCWGMISSMEIQRGQHIGIDTFSKFLEESYDSRDLLFFLFMRNAIGKVMGQPALPKDAGSNRPVNDQKKAGAEQTMTKTDSQKPSLRESRRETKVATDMMMDLKQVVQAVKMSIDHKAQALRDQVIKKLDVAMAARQESRIRKTPSLEPDRLLAIAVEEYHLSRGKIDPPVLHDSTQPIPKLEDLSDEQQEEVGRVSTALLRSLSANGESQVDPKQVQEWALQTTIRRHKLAPDSPQTTRLTTWVEKLLGEQEKKDGSTITSSEDMASSEDVLQLSAAQFASNLENNVRQLLLNATADLVDDVVSTLPHKSWKENSDSAKAMKAALLSEFAPMADTLMEAIVGQDYQKWLATLCITKGTDKLKAKFDDLHKEFETVMSTEISVEVVQQICQTVVDPDEFYDLVTDQAKKLAKLGDAKKLGESSSDEDDLKPLPSLAATSVKGSGEFEEDTW